MSINSLVLCSIDNTCVKAYPEWTTKVRLGCHDDTLMTTCEGIKIHFDVDAFLELGIIFTPYVKQRLTEALACNNPAINTISRRAIAIIMEKDPHKLKRWQCNEDFDPNFITHKADGHIVYAKGSSIDIIMECCIIITPTMWCHMCDVDRQYACQHCNFGIVTEEWSPIFRMAALR